MTLMEEVLEARVAPDELAVFWLGQNSFILKTSRGTLVGIDLYLSRVYAVERHKYADPPIAPDHVVVDYAFSTHDHLDHLDPYTVPGILKCSPRAVFVSTPEGRKHLVKLGVPPSQAVGMKAGEAMRFGELEATAFYSIDPREKPDTTHYGYVFSLPVGKLYNMGDSSPGVVEHPLNVLKPVIEARPDIAMLPIIGDYPGRRPEHALVFAKVIKPRIVIPTHYGCFTNRDVDPAEFTRLFADLPDIKPIVIDYKGKYTYRAEHRG
ncbi:MAG: MBL fold metallo-hydrolase [Candidatus Bathyarchaeia archaeon]